MRITFWQNIPSHLQSACIRALANEAGIHVRVIIEAVIPERRSSSGWSMPDYGDAEVIIAPAPALQRELIRDAECCGVNIFSGVSGYSLPSRAFRACLRGASQVGVLSEAGRWPGAKGVLRVARARHEARSYAHAISFILAIGHLGERWFDMVGYPRAKTFRFGYFVHSPETFRSHAPIQRDPTSPFSIVFIGQLVKRKGVSTLLHALARVPDDGWTLDVIGTGEEAGALMRLSRTLGIDGRVSFHGALANARAMRVLELGDLLVLPSNWDGWGAVVNESLMRGVPVVCSHMCGAADLLHEAWRGTVFRAGSVDDLERALRERLMSGKVTDLERARIASWSRLIEGTVAASYMLDVIRASCTASVRPTPPWLGVEPGVAG